MNHADDIRADFQKIKDRYLGLPDAIGSIRLSTIEKVEETITHLERKVADVRPCACGSERPVFEVKTANRPIDFSFQLRRAQRMRDEDQANGWAGVFAQADERRALRA